MARMPRPLGRTGSTRESQEPGHEFGLARDAVRSRRTMCFNLCVRECAVAESADAQPRALSAAAAVRIPMISAGSVAVSSCFTAMRPLLSSEPPVWSRFRTISHTSSDPLWSGKRRKRDQTGGSDEQTEADDHRRCFADPPGQTWLRSINQLKRPTRPANSRDCAGRDARYGISNKYLFQND
jgi:hypothetical protein